MSHTPEQLQNIIEAALMAAGHPLTVSQLQNLFDEAHAQTNDSIKAALDALKERYASTSLTIVEVASGFQFQVKTEFASAISRLWEERPPRYTRAFLETLSLIAYRQPITRAEIEEIRGVVVSPTILKTLTDREWVRIMGYKDTPGKPALYGTTKVFLDYFNLKSLDELPSLAELRNLESQEEKFQIQLELVQAEAEVEVEAELEEYNE